MLKRFGKLTPMNRPPTLRTPLRYLSSSAVTALMPGLERQLDLVRSAYRAKRDGTCDAPATPEIVPRPGAVAHAMPAYVSEEDVTSVKWILDNQSNRKRGLPLVAGLIIVNDSETGLPMAIMDASAITAARTAAASTVCVNAVAGRSWSTVGIIGYGIQARAHVKALSTLNPSATFRVFSRRALDSKDPRVSFAESPQAATDGADVVVTGMPLGTKLQPPLASDWLVPTALVLPLDDDASLDADVVNGAGAFYVDDFDDYRRRQGAGIFAGWREPDGVVPEAVLKRRTAEGVIVCANQGMGVLDAVFAGYVVDAAEREGVGTLLER
jgi:alanine dehydrogenase